MIDQIRDLLTAADVLDLRRRTAAALSDIGFGAAYFISPLNSARRAETLMANSGFPQAWEEAYRGGAGKDDPVPALALASARPVIWNRLPPDTELTPGETAYLARLEDWGMQAGVGVVTYGPAGRVGFLGAGLPKSQAVADNPDVALVQVIAEMSFLRYCQLIEDEIDALPGLSPREFDVLELIAQGKSKLKIADELGVSKDTVDTYFRRIYAKLDVSDRAAAVAAAMTRGILMASDMRVSRAMLRRQPSARD